MLFFLSDFKGCVMLFEDFLFVIIIKIWGMLGWLLGFKISFFMLVKFWFIFWLLNGSGIRLIVLSKSFFLVILLKFIIMWNVFFFMIRLSFDFNFEILKVLVIYFINKIVWI